MQRGQTMRQRMAKGGPSQGVLEQSWDEAECAKASVLDGVENNRS